jgi:hypothetical protein
MICLTGVYIWIVRLAGKTAQTALLPCFRYIRIWIALEPIPYDPDQIGLDNLVYRSAAWHVNHFSLDQLDPPLLDVRQLQEFIDGQ